MAADLVGDMELTEPLLWNDYNSGRKPEKHAELIKKINAKNAKFIAFGLILGFILYHGLIHLRYGNNSCKWLLSDGRYKGDMEWQPYGCMMHKYSQTDTRRCMRYLAFWGRYNQFVFIGDSRVYQMYLAFLDHLTGHTSRPQPVPSNHNFNDTQLKLTVTYVHSPFVSDTMVQMFHVWQKAKPPPSVIVAGAAAWSIRYGNDSTKAVEEYTYNLTRLVDSMDKIVDNKGQVLWALQEPVSDEKAVETNTRIDLYNRAAMEVLEHSKVEVWSSCRLVAQTKQPGQAIYLHDTQILLNSYCNDHMNYNDGTCCSSAEPYTSLQVVTFSVLAVCFILGCGMAVKRKLQGLRADPPTAGYILTTSLAKLGLIMAYFYLCDRTNFFMKENKYYSPVSFWLPIGYVFALGLFFTEDSRYTKVLHRDQTEEWKGWMQLVILIYNMTGATSNLQIYNHVRMLISAYLFLNGYGHFYYLWHRSDAGIVRFFQVLFRLNMTTVILCLCMNRPYQFYYYVPVVSFWFSLLYLVLVAPPRVTAASCEHNPLHYLYLVLKLVGLFSFIIMLYMSEVFFDKVFVTRPWKALFVTTDDDIHEWWFRWKLDRYSTSYGAVFAMMLLFAQNSSLVDDNNHSNLFTSRIALCSVFIAFVGLGCSSTFALLCQTKAECNEVHSYTVFIPVTMCFFLRNVSGILRTRYSSFFAWFGRYPLELFVTQYHVWLAADNHGVLVLLPGYPVLNVLISCFIMVCVTHELHDLTRALLPFAVPNDWRLVLRNIGLFLMVLIPIGIHDGMF
ncbi:LOW QUALITY PROTEIN: N-acetylneuraminate 9-O-acetyltransferase [Homalodisca vitripennis]|uniref:LOW QUALITY PROTEIN: N-acetylneuraminate 9-O-acetyltransferase n=1 Tax=Homalodisca vitripennis TaxID=197043 RepID=UPI001EEC5ADF|nr:LOW QUALITY PROTEIN: N-acetylneuraminate 9-O-acetyltransferase [Homalodisca vitripennis]